MGMDCQAWIEYRAHHEDWDCLARIHFSRDRPLYHAMGASSEAPVQPRGLPHDHSFLVRWGTRLLVTDRTTAGDGCISREQAAAISRRDIEAFREGEYILDPSEHGHGWLAPDEFEQAIALADHERPEVDRHEARAVLAAMRALPEARLVFCFNS